MPNMKEAILLATMSTITHTWFSRFCVRYPNLSRYKDSQEANYSRHIIPSHQPDHKVSPLEDPSLKKGVDELTMNKNPTTALPKYPAANVAAAFQLQNAYQSPIPRDSNRISPPDHIQRQKRSTDRGRDVPERVSGTWPRVDSWAVSVSLGGAGRSWSLRLSSGPAVPHESYEPRGGKTEEGKNEIVMSSAYQSQPSVIGQTGAKGTHDTDRDDFPAHDEPYEHMTSLMHGHCE